MKLPNHLNALRAFEASARHQSFSAAAEELNVTSAAVGQLVRSLEDVVGAPLFVRSNSGRLRLIPTEVAALALPDLRAGFERLADGLEQLKNGAGNDLLTVTISPAFAAKWLLPRIDSFQQQWPTIDVRLDTSLKPVDFKSQRVDVGVRYGNGVWPGLQAEKLMDEEIFPVCSPQLCKEQNMALPTVLSTTALIHDLSMDNHRDFPTWQSWLNNAGFKGQIATRSMQINNSAAVLQAAIDGHGIALARSVMARDDVACGRLIRLWPHIQCPANLAYYLVYRPECAHLAKINAFRSWLLQQVN